MPHSPAPRILRPALLALFAVAAACQPMRNQVRPATPVPGVAGADTMQLPTIVPLADGNVLYVLDGRVLKTPSGTTLPDEIRTLAPEQIANVEVLKGTAAKERYGSRGENGVVMITTRKDSGEKQKS